MYHTKCGSEVITETVTSGYSYVCTECDEDLFTFEVMQYEETARKIANEVQTA